MRKKLLKTAVTMLLVLAYSIIKPEAQESQSLYEPASRKDPPFLVTGEAWADSLMGTMSLEDRIAQMIITRVHRAKIMESEHLDPTPRGEGGFGHSGMK